MTNTRAVPYILRWRPNAAAVGAHASIREGIGGMFRRHTSLLRYPDPRRIDFRMTLQDPLEEIHVRQFSQRSAISVIALVDLTGSMGFAGSVSRLRVVAELCATLALSAQEMGDRFGLIGCDADVREEVFIPPTRRRGLDEQILQLLIRQQPKGANASGLIAGARCAPAQRSLVFLISDFLMPIALIEDVMAALWRHDVVPVVFDERGELERLPHWRLTELRDLETGRKRLILLRPAVASAWRRMQVERHEMLFRLFARHGRTAFHILDRLDVEALAGYLTAR